MVGEKIYTVRLLKVINMMGVRYDVVKEIVKVSANDIAENDENLLFYDRFGNLVGRFRKDLVISFAVEEG